MGSPGAMSARKKPSSISCGSQGASGRPGSHAAIVARFIAEWRDNAAREHRYFARFPTLAAAIEVAALSEYPRGKRHPHQCRIPQRVLQTARRRLLSAESAIRTAADFEELHDLLHGIIGGVPGIGALTVYDIATRIGAHLGLEPKYVFVHSGVRVGARAVGHVGRPRLALDELPRPFRRLSPGEAEDCLCIFKADLKVLSATNAVRG